MRLKFFISPFDVSSSVEVSSTMRAEFKMQPSFLIRNLVEVVQIYTPCQEQD
jgi:hypothetical protein